LVTFEQWNGAAAGDRAALVDGSLAAVSPGWSATQLGHALISAAETLVDVPDKAAAARREIILVSDFQEGSHLEALQAYEWPKGIEMSVEPLKARPANNASLQLVGEADESQRNAAPVVRVRVS